MSNFTPWYPVLITPARVGWYEVSYWRNADPKFSRVLDGRRYWTGKRWQFGPRGLECAMGCNPQDAWRGLAQDPSNESNHPLRPL